MTPDERIKVCELIESIIAADGVVADEERAFLRRVLERFGISEADYGDRIVTSDAGRVTTRLRTLSPDVQMRVMALLVDAAVVDGTVAPEERALLLAAAAALGVEAAALEERIAQRLASTTRGA
ncbi:MAG TPA: TerB family tellurite resistance protein [Minicystis sp.]|nr:TerB family tellurite resistance protein [Minicystis sp.]